MPDSYWDQAYEDNSVTNLYGPSDIVAWTDGKCDADDYGDELVNTMKFMEPAANEEPPSPDSNVHSDNYDGPMTKNIKESNEKDQTCLMMV